MQGTFAPYPGVHRATAEHAMQARIVALEVRLSSYLLLSESHSSSFFGRASNSLSSLPTYSQPLPICVSSPGRQHVIHRLPPFAFLPMTWRHHKARAPSRESHEMRSRGNVESAFSSPRCPLVAPRLRLSLPHHLCRACKIYAVCSCLHAIQVPEMDANVI
jgi:hypothetical protein